jgi:hypothetical protein
MATSFYEVDERILYANVDKLQFNGFKVLQGNELKYFKLQFGTDINVATKTTVLGVFDFRSLIRFQWNKHLSI